MSCREEFKAEDGRCSRVGRELIFFEYWGRESRSGRRLAVGEGVEEGDEVVVEGVWEVVGGAAGEGNGILGLIWHFPSSGEGGRAGLTDSWHDSATSGPVDSRPVGQWDPADSSQGQIKGGIKVGF